MYNPMKGRAKLYIINDVNKVNKTFPVLYVDIFII